MQKCRTCTALSLVRRCLYEGSPNKGYVACDLYNPRETPLLVDALGEVLRAVWDSRFTDGGSAGQYPSGCERPGYTIMLTPEQCAVIDIALARYKEEVVDA